MREQPNKKTFTLKLAYLYTQIIPDESFHSSASSATWFVSLHVTPVIQQRTIKQYHQDFPLLLKGGNKEEAYLS